MIVYMLCLREWITLSHRGFAWTFVMEYSKSKVENNVKSVFFFQNILSKKCGKNLAIRTLQYVSYKCVMYCTYRNMVREYTSLHDNVMQILSPFEPWVFLLVHMWICLMCCPILIPKYGSTWNIYFMYIVLNNSVPTVKKKKHTAFPLPGSVLSSCIGQ